MGFIVRAQSPYSPAAKFPQLKLSAVTYYPASDETLGATLAMLQTAGFSIVDSGLDSAYHSEWQGMFGAIPNGFHVELPHVTPFDPNNPDCYPAIVADGQTRDSLSKAPSPVFAPPLPPIVHYGPF